MPGCVVSFLIVVFGVLAHYREIECTSSQNLHNLLRHPHYADKHQHSLKQLLSYRRFALARRRSEEPCSKQLTHACWTLAEAVSRAIAQCVHPDPQAASLCVERQ
ncbi:hypothetical protein CDAR_31721 [Caerostris darwini]|uniref:Secreted protein n=1 Tax=Caerostris darwini TaxID=1538125 RepID=A0AAV4NRC3_9ARAC|nr:hypothetical protein CDAR_31721 [Caerostris darwini]